MKINCIMRKSEQIVIIILIALFSVGFTSHSVLEKSKDEKLEVVFSEIEKGFSGGNVSTFSQYLSSQNYLSLSNGVRGYYSANQSFYILQEYFKLHRPISFRFSSKSEGKNPYATGFLTYELRGRRENAQVFIALESSGGSWKISQITIR